MDGSTVNSPQVTYLTMSLNRNQKKDIVRYIDNVLERSRTIFDIKKDI